MTAYVKLCATTFGTPQHFGSH